MRWQHRTSVTLLNAPKYPCQILSDVSSNCSNSHMVGMGCPRKREGLSYTVSYDIMEAPSVSGLQGYRELCLASRNEEKRLLELAKRQQYRRSPQQLPGERPHYQPAGHRPPLNARDETNGPVEHQISRNQPPRQFLRVANVGSRRCYRCDKPGHLAWECREPRMESTGQRANPSQGQGQVGTRQTCNSSS